MGRNAFWHLIPFMEAFFNEPQGRLCNCGKDDTLSRPCLCSGWWTTSVLSSVSQMVGLSETFIDGPFKGNVSLE